MRNRRTFQPSIRSCTFIAFSAENQAILVGHRTLSLDHPTLTVRHWAGNNPLRVVLGRIAEGELPAGFQAFADKSTMLSELYRQGIQTLLVEGGQQTLQSFIDEGLWDEAYVEVGQTVLGSGVPEPRMPVGVTLTPRQVFGATVWHYVNNEEGPRPTTTWAKHLLLAAKANRATPPPAPKRLKGKIKKNVWRSIA